MQLENLAYESRPVQEQRQQVYFVVGDLEKLSSTALYGYGNNSGGKVGSSSFDVILPLSNILPPSNPSTYQRIVGQSGVDYFNTDGSLAGRIVGLNKSERDYLNNKD